ncbi:MAG: hypothetical protein GWP06_19245, partial [Actinobacteria bacterium]|nr:hypothetical protein [Actinomycetota bacterium]
MRVLNDVKFYFILFLAFSFSLQAKNISGMERAKLYPIVADKPAPDFFSGALLGNGGLGVVVCTRPDAVVLYFGHNNVWDIRIAENNRDKIGTFKQVFEKVKSIPDTLENLDQDPWYRKYRNMARENYNKPYPRPFPCGSIVLGFDRRKVELLGHRLDISNGLCEVRLLAAKRPLRLQIFTDMAGDRVWLRLVDAKGHPAENCFERIHIMPDPSTPQEFPEYSTDENKQQNLLSFQQILPYQEPEKYDPVKGDPKDHAFRLIARTSTPMQTRSRLDWSGNKVTMGNLERGLESGAQFISCIQLDEGLATQIKSQPPRAPQPTADAWQNAFAKSSQIWQDFWARSAVQLGDSFLEKIWYHNLYFINCSVKAGATCPGLFANWSYNKIGTAWHGDYHFNYNLQQPFWVTFSSNHVDKNLPYVDLIDRILPMSQRWAKEYYGLRGAYFPHSAYPVDMTMNPYPVPTWGWEVCETPWAVQSLWWHYLYTMDQDFLKNRAYIPIKNAVLFLVDYMKRPEAHGKQWGDDKYHIFPTVPPELYGLKPGFKYNYDCLVDLTLTKFVFKAFLRTTKILHTRSEEADLIADVEKILKHFPEYPTAISQKYGRVFVSVPGEHSEVVYNVPNSLMTVFPGEDHGLHSDAETLALLQNTWHNFQVEGGNELVFQNLQAARLGLLDLERFKRQIRYCLLPDGTATDMVLQVHGRYNDFTKFDFMAPLGIWFENFSLPVVINECLMQSYDGTIRMFPNWPKSTDARFKTLRAVNAFLVSASFVKGNVEWVRIKSEAGKNLRMVNPWAKGARVITRRGEQRCEGGIIELQTKAGEN